MQLCGADAILNLGGVQGIAAMAKGMLGLPKAGYEISWNQVITHMLTIKGVYGREMFDTWYKASFMLGSSPALRDAVRTVITHRFPAEEGAPCDPLSCGGHSPRRRRPLDGLRGPRRRPHAGGGRGARGRRVADRPRAAGGRPR